MKFTNETRKEENVKKQFKDIFEDDVRSQRVKYLCDDVFKNHVEDWFEDLEDSFEDHVEDFFEDQVKDSFEDHIEDHMKIWS